MKKKEPPRFNPELDGHGRVLSPVLPKHLPKPGPGESAFAASLRQALAGKGR